MSVLLAILALGVLVVVHEAGHYFVARWSKMRVERFSIGFGPALLKWKHGETQFQVAPIPFGGFVQITGMNPHEEFDEKDPNVYPNRPAILRFLTILAGPGMNYVAAVIVVFALNLGAGVETGTAWFTVEGVSKGQPADGKLQKGDRLLEVSGVPVWAALKGEPGAATFSGEIQKAAGQPVEVKVLRGQETVVVALAPQLSRPPPEVQAQIVALQQFFGVEQPMREKYLVGINLGVHAERAALGVGASAASAAAYPIETTEFILAGLWKVIRGEVSAELSGPVGIVDAMEEQIDYGWVRALEVIALLNVYLGLFNLLPIPGLDGGRLAFLTYELATRRRPNPRVEATVHMFGFLFLFVVIILVTFKDIGKVLGM